MPSEGPEAPIQTFRENDIAQDWLKPDNKRFPSMHKEGRDERYPGYDDRVVSELVRAKQFLNAAKPHPGDATPAPHFQVLPETQRSEGEASQHIHAEADGHYIIPSACHGPSNSARRSRFRLPGDGNAGARFSTDHRD